MGRFAAHGRVDVDRAELFGRVVFNILVSNDGDHLRNHAVVWWPEARGWTLSPLYDVLKATEVVLRVSMVTREWRTAFNELGVGDDECDKVAVAFNDAAMLLP